MLPTRGHWPGGDKEERVLILNQTHSSIFTDDFVISRRSVPFTLYVFGLPLALFLSQKVNSGFDRLITWIAPISSVPSWVIGIILIMIFAVEF